MITRGILATLSVALFSVFLFTACDVMSEKGFEESLAPYLELEPLNGEETTSITIHKGTEKDLDSFFAFDLSENLMSGMVKSGLQKAWCVEWDKPLDSNGAQHDNIKVYSTFGSDRWRPANYLLTSVRKLKSEFPNITYKEIQVALWGVIDNPDFDLDEVLKNGDMPARMMNNGLPDFDVEVAKKLIKHVKENQREYKYKLGKKFIAYTRTNDPDQNGGFLVCGETAWAANGDTPGELRYNSGGGNWATYVEYKGVEKTVKLFAGQTIDIGTVTFSAPTDGEITITVDLNEDGFFKDGGENVKIQGYDVEPSGNPAPGQFNYKGSADPNGKSYSITVPAKSFYGVHVDTIECEDEDEGEDDEDDDD